MVENELKDEALGVSVYAEEGVEDEGEDTELPNPWISFVILRAFKRASLSVGPPPRRISIWSDFFCMLEPQLNLS